MTLDMIDAFLSLTSDESIPCPQGSGTSEAGSVGVASMLNGYLAGARWYSNGRHAFRTVKGRLGTIPRAMQPGDELVVLFGGRMPFVVRPREWVSGAG